jgi:hypothetical protein
MEKCAFEQSSRVYNMDVQIYTENKYIPVANGCFAFMFTNVGDTKADINGMVVFPSATPTTALGDSRSISGHEMDLYKGTMQLKFYSPVGAGAAVEVVQLYYVVQ